MVVVVVGLVVLVVVVVTPALMYPATLLRMESALLASGFPHMICTLNR
jgi:hypothetical protein